MWKSKGIIVLLASLVIVTMLAAGGCSIFNKSPEITSLTPSATSVARGESCTISCVASDPDTDDVLTYAWSATGGSISGTGDSVTWTAPTDIGAYSVTVTVSDGEEVVSDSCNIQVVNSPPVIASLNPSATEIAPEDSCTIGCVASDADGDTLSYTWSATGGAISGTGDNVSWEAPAAEGTYTITVNVSDGQGGAASDSCDIVVEMKFGSIDIQSSPAGASVFLNGVDTGNITPYVITNLTPGTYIVELRLYHYKYRQQAVTVNPNETTYINWSLTYAPEIAMTLQPGPSAGKDSGTSTFGPDVNWGTEEEMDAGYGFWGIYRAHIKINLGSLPENAVITSAKLGLFYWNTYGTGIAPIGAYAIEEAWDETTITWNNQPDSATTPEYTVNVPASETNAFVYWYITDLVKGWWDGSIYNSGIVLMDPDESTAEGIKGFYTSDWGTSAERPKLVITYFDPFS